MAVHTNNTAAVATNDHHRPGFVRTGLSKVNAARTTVNEKGKAAACNGLKCVRRRFELSHGDWISGAGEITVACHFIIPRCPVSSPIQLKRGYSNIFMRYD